MVAQSTLRSQNDVDYWSVRVLYHTMGVLWDRSIGGPSLCGSTACSPGDGGVLARDLSTRWGKRMANVSGGGLVPGSSVVLRPGTVHGS